jgi:hypothetical protein
MTRSLPITSYWSSYIYSFPQHSNETIHSYADRLVDLVCSGRHVPPEQKARFHTECLSAIDSHIDRVSTPPDTLSRYYFTFGSSHFDSAGHSLSHNYTTIDAVDENTAREIMFLLRRSAWLSSYPNPSYVVNRKLLYRPVQELILHNQTTVL